MFCLVVTSGSEEKNKKGVRNLRVPTADSSQQDQGAPRRMASNIRAWSSRRSLDNLPQESKTPQASGTSQRYGSSPQKLCPATAISNSSCSIYLFQPQKGFVVSPQLVSRGGCMSFLSCWLPLNSQWYLNKQLVSEKSQESSYQSHLHWCHSHSMWHRTQTHTPGCDMQPLLHPRSHESFGYSVLFPFSNWKVFPLANCLHFTVYLRNQIGSQI